MENEDKKGLVKETIEDANEKFGDEIESAKEEAGNAIECAADEVKEAITNLFKFSLLFLISIMVC